jgi:hypothetical protein
MQKDNPLDHTPSVLANIGNEETKEKRNLLIENGKINSDVFDFDLERVFRRWQETEIKRTCQLFMGTTNLCGFNYEYHNSTLLILLASLIEIQEKVSIELSPETIGLDPKQSKSIKSFMCLGKLNGLKVITLPSPIVHILFLKEDKEKVKQILSNKDLLEAYGRNLFGEEFDASKNY